MVFTHFRKFSLLANFSTQICFCSSKTMKNFNKSRKFYCLCDMSCSMIYDKKSYILATLMYMHVSNVYSYVCICILAMYPCMQVCMHMSIFV